MIDFLIAADESQKSSGLTRRQFVFLNYLSVSQLVPTIKR